MVSFVMLGGAFGAVLRFSSLQLLVQRFHLQSAYALWLVNVGGSLLAGLLLAILFHTISTHHEWFLSLVVVGFLGSYTSVSAFGLETLQFLMKQRWFSALGYVVASIMGCLLGFASGWFIPTLALALVR